MAKVKFGAIVTDMRNKVGGQVFSKNRYGAYTRSFKLNVPSNTPAQIATRTRLSNQSTAWRNLTDDQRNGWNQAVANFLHTDVFGSIIKPSGFDLFVKLNCNLDQVGESPLTIPPTPGVLMNVKTFSVANAINIPVLTINADNSLLTSDYKLVVSATAPISPGKNYVKNLLREIAVLPFDTVFPYDITSEYVSKFTTLTGGQRVSLSIIGVNTVTGQKTAPLYTTTIVTELDDSTIALLDAMSTIPALPEILAINDFIVGLKSANIWDELDFMQVYAQETEQASLLNWKDPSVFTASYIGTPAFTSDRGVDNTGAGNAINTNFNPKTDGVKFLLDDATFGCYINDHLLAQAGIDMGVSDATTKFTQLYAYHSFLLSIAYINQGGSTGLLDSSFGAGGLWIAKRAASNANALYHDASLVISSTDASTDIASVPFYVGATDFSNSISNQNERQYALAFAGSSNINIATFYSLVQAFMTAVGANV